MFGPCLGEIEGGRHFSGLGDREDPKPESAADRVIKY